MFKIQDNDDGSTSVYCKNSGNLLCTIPAKQNSNVPRRVNVVEPQPVAVAGPSLQSSWHPSKEERTQLAKNELIRCKEEPCREPRTSFRESQCCISPIPISPDGDQSEDYFDDCITQDSFAKCLNLVSRERLQTQDRKSLQAEYPLRLLSRSKAYRTLEDLQDLKLPDYMPLTSYLGMKVLELNRTRNFSSPQKVQIAVKKYDSFCRFPFNCPKPSICHFPKLRCREKKMYPIATTAKTLRHDANHFYTHGRRQRQERMKVMATGLNKRSRKLLKMCKKCTVKLKRLTKVQITMWKRKSAASGAVSMLQNATSFTATRQPTSFSKCAPRKTWFHATPGTSFLSSDPPFLLQTPLSSGNSLCKPLGNPVPGPSTFRTKALSSSMTEDQEPKCFVVLKNVIQYIHKLNGQYYVRGTRILIPFYANFLRRAEQRKRSEVRSDHAYCSSFSKQYLQANCSPEAGRTPKTPLKPCNATLESCRQHSAEDDGKPIPLIDLTVDTTPPKAPHHSPTLASQWKFRCFACGFHCFYRNIGTPADAAAADAAIRQHMQYNHSVLEPDCFITKYLDRVNKCTIVEAFPGFKG